MSWSQARQRRRRARPHARVESPTRRSSRSSACEALRKRFSGGRGGGAVAALAGVSIEVGEGESVGLVGESGSGKTTLARCLVGLETPTRGGSSIDGIDASDYARLDAARRGGNSGGTCR